MKTRTRNLKAEDARTWFKSQRVPKGWKKKILKVGERIPDGGWDTFQEPNQKGNPWSWQNLLVGVVYNEDTTLIIRFSNNPSCIGTGGKRGWLVKTVVQDHDGEESTIEDIIGYGGWYEKFTSVKQIRSGLTKRYTTQWKDSGSGRSRRVKNGSKVVSMEIIPVKSQRVSFSGTTRFKVDDGYRTFDRLGVEDSFYGDDQQSTLKGLVQQQMERVNKTRDRIGRSESIPDGFGWMVTPETKKEYSERLQSGGCVSFRPSGFGTGKTLYGRQVKGYGVGPASKAVAEFFGCEKLWVQLVECD